MLMSQFLTKQLWRVNESTFYLRVSNGEFVRISTRSSRLMAKATNPSTMEEFVIVRNSNNCVRIKAPNGSFVQVSLFSVIYVKLLSFFVTVLDYWYIASSNSLVY